MPMYISSLDECLFRSLAHFIIVFLLLSCKNSFYILDTSLFHIYIWPANIFYSLGCLLPFLRTSFEAQMFWNLMILLFSFAVISKKPLPNPRSQRFIPVFFSVFYKVLVLILSLWPTLISVYGEWPSDTLLQVTVQQSPHHLLKGPFVPPLNCVGPSVDVYMRVYFWILYSMVFSSTLMPIPHCLD